jgi:hypothetical protein
MEVWTKKVNKCVMIYLDGTFRFSAVAHHTQTITGVHVAFFQKISGVVSLGVKWCDYKADHSHLPSARIKRTWSYTSITPLLTYGAEPFLRSCQLCSHLRNSQQF